jgi:hypothetical protein
MFLHPCVLQSLSIPFYSSGLILILQTAKLQLRNAARCISPMRQPHTISEQMERNSTINLRVLSCLATLHHLRKLYACHEMGVKQLAREDS